MEKMCNMFALFFYFRSQIINVIDNAITLLSCATRDMPNVLHDTNNQNAAPYEKCHDEYEAKGGNGKKDISEDVMGHTTSIAPGSQT